MILNLRGYDVKVRYIPGNKKIVADTLSRAAVPSAEEEGYEVFPEINLILSVSEERYEEFKKETKLDAEWQVDRTMVINGWPDTKEQVPIEARPYWSFRDEVAVADGLVSLSFIRLLRVVITLSVRSDSTVR